MSAQYFEPEWTVPKRVRAAMTLRRGGVSVAPFDRFNLGAHVGDEAADVARNRALLRVTLDLPSEPRWLQQVHGAQVHHAKAEAEPGVALSAPPVAPAPPAPPMADAAICLDPGVVLAVLVADCLPVLLADRAGTVIGAAHAGWRGLAAGVIESTVRAMAVPPHALTAWLGPAISQRHFEVGDEVLQAFTATDADAAACFIRNARGRWQCDLPGLARRRLQALGVAAISDCGRCTVEQAPDFYSFRRDGRTGRMAALLWLAP